MDKARMEPAVSWGVYTFAAGRWDLPGGGVQPDESIADGAARECWEETGRRFSAGTPPAIRFIGEDRFYLDPAVEPAASPFRHSLLFTVEGTATLEPQPSWRGAPDECRRAEWVDPRLLSPANTHPNHWKALRDARVVPDHAVSVRRALPEDAGRILDVPGAANAEYAGRWALSAAAETTADVLGDLQRGAVFLAAVDGQCVGAVRCRVLEDGVGYIKRLAVLPAWRRGGSPPS